MTATTVRIAAHAKLNLFLRVLAREADGYHGIETLFCLLDLADELVAERRDGGHGVTIDVAGADVGPAAENLAARAAALVLEATVRTAVARARGLAPDLPLVAGGKSMGGRMTSSAAARRPLDAVRGLIFLGFPLHPSKQPSTTRAEHLAQASLPMLFLQGTRDTLADLDLITRVCAELGERATLHVVEGADHGFSVLKRSGRTDAEVMDELADTTADWVRRV